MALKHPALFAGLPLVLVAAMLASPAAALAEEGGPAPSLFSGNIWNSIWALTIFVILLLVLGRFAWRPIVKVLEDREHKIVAALEESEAKQKQAAELLEQYRRQLAEAQSEAGRLIAQAKTEAEKVGRTILDDARGEAEEARKQAVQQIEASKDAAIAELFDNAASMAARAAGQILKREIRPQEHRQLIEQTLSEMAAQRKTEWKA